MTPPFRVRPTRRVLAVVSVPLLSLLVAPQLAGAQTQGAACPSTPISALAEACATAQGSPRVSSSAQPGTIVERAPATVTVTGSARSSAGVTALTSTQSCTYYDTRYAEGSGSGDVLYGYTDPIGAKAAAYAESTFPLVYQNRIAYVTMTAGHRLQWLGEPAEVNGRIVMPWFEGGSITTNTDTSFFATTNASGSMQIETGVVDEGVWEQKSIETTHLQSGQSSKNYSDSQPRTYYVNFEAGHTYRPYIRVTGSAQAQGNVFNPGLRANSLVDWLGGSNGAYLDFVRYEFDLPDGYTLSCGS